MIAMNSPPDGFVNRPGGFLCLKKGKCHYLTSWRNSYLTPVSEGMGGSSAIQIQSTPLDSGYFLQTIPINLPYTETYVLSGWAKADALPANQERHYTAKLFTLKAEVYYSDGVKEDFFLPFSAEIDGEWQFASRVIVPSRKYNVTKILVICAYHYNVGDALFDNISLVREPAQTMTYDTNGYLTSVATPGVGADTNTYSNGNLTKVQTPGSGTYTYTYDSNHNVLTASNGQVKQTYTYDAAGLYSRSSSAKNGATGTSR